jgi:hypothetical protein
MSCSAAAGAHPCTSLSLPRTFIGLVYNLFELIKIKLKKDTTIFCYLGELIRSPPEWKEVFALAAADDVTPPSHPTTD